MTFFDSEIVQDEARRLWDDYHDLIALGANYGKFDREGKKLYIAQMEEITDRYRIFLKRFELSDDFMAKMTVKQLQMQLSQHGMNAQQMLDHLRETLAKMKDILFGASLFPYLAFLWFITRSGTLPKLALAGFYSTLVFVAITIPAGIYAQNFYHKSLANVDWLHGSAESFLTIGNIILVLGLSGKKQQ